MLGRIGTDKSISHTSTSGFPRSDRDLQFHSLYTMWRISAGASEPGLLSENIFVGDCQDEKRDRGTSLYSDVS